jgi:hypothetical protein
MACPQPLSTGTTPAAWTPIDDLLGHVGFTYVTCFGYPEPHWHIACLHCDYVSVQVPYVMSWTVAVQVASAHRRSHLTARAREEQAARKSQH